MLSRLVAGIVTSYLGEYFQDVDTEQVGVSVWRGHVHLRHLKVRQDALRHFDLPICVAAGIIDDLLISIPWTRLQSESVVVEMNGVQLMLMDKETAAYPMDQEQREAMARKVKALEDMDVLLFALPGGSPAATQSGAPATSNESSDSTFSTRLRASILTNLKVRVQNLSVQFASCECSKEAKNSPDLLRSASEIEQLAELSFHIEEVASYGCDVNFSPAFVPTGLRELHKVIQITGVTAHFGVVLSEEKARQSPPIFGPLNVTIQVAHQPVHLSQSQPQHNATVFIGNCFCRVDNQMLRKGCRVVGQLQHVGQLLQQRRLRPLSQRPDAAPRKWWRYAIDAVQQQCGRIRRVSQHLLLHAFSWRHYIDVKRKREEYIVLFMRRHRVRLSAAAWLNALSAAEEEAVSELEFELPLEVLRLAKKLALQRVEIERAEFASLLTSRGHSPATVVAAAPHPQKEVAMNCQPAVPWWMTLWKSAMPSRPRLNESSTVEQTTKTLEGTASEEMQELVQLMAAARWSEAERATIAEQFGMSAAEAQELSQAPTVLPAAASNFNFTPAPLRVLMLHLEGFSLTICKKSTPSTVSEAAVPQFSAENDFCFQMDGVVSGVEWGGESRVFSTWVAAREGRVQTHAAGQSCTVIQVAQVATEADQAKYSQRPASAVTHPAAHTHIPLPSPPLTWTSQCCDYLTSSGFHFHYQHGLSHQQQECSPGDRAGLQLAPVKATLQMTVLRHLTDLLLTIFETPSTAIEDVVPGVRSCGAQSTETNNNDYSEAFTALVIPSPTLLSRWEATCLEDLMVRRRFLQRRVEQQTCFAWSLELRQLTVEFGQVVNQSEVVVSFSGVHLQNDWQHRMSRALRCSTKDEETPVGALAADWVNRYDGHVAALGVAVLDANGTCEVGTPYRHELLKDCPLSFRIETSFVGRCEPTTPRVHLAIDSSAEVHCSWSRSSLSLLISQGALWSDFFKWLTDTAMGLRQGGEKMDQLSQSALTASKTAPSQTFEELCIAVQPTWRYSVEDDYVGNPLDQHFEAGHPLSSSAVVGHDARYRVRVLPGVCIVHHTMRSSLPYLYFELRRGEFQCNIAGEGLQVELFLHQGGKSHEEARRGYLHAKKVLMVTVGVPEAILRNPVLLQDAVEVWRSSTSLSQDASKVEVQPAQEAVAEALRILLEAASTVPSRYICFQCETPAEAEALHAVLLSSAISSSSLRLNKALQDAVAEATPPPLRAQPLVSVSLSLPSVILSVFAEDAKATEFASVTSLPSCRTILRLYCLALEYALYPEKQTFELSIQEKLQACWISNSSDGPIDLLTVAQNPSQAAQKCTDPSEATLCLTGVLHQRPSPLPSKVEAMLKSASKAEVNVNLCPYLLDSLEAWWDSAALLRNSVFNYHVFHSAKWTASSLSEETAARCTLPDAYLSERRVIRYCVGAQLSSVVLRIAVSEASQPTSSEHLSSNTHESLVAQFGGSGVVLDWTQSEDQSCASLRLQSPSLQLGYGADSRCNEMKHLSTLLKPRSDELSLLRASWTKTSTSTVSLPSLQWSKGRSSGVVESTGFEVDQHLQITLDNVGVVYWHPFYTQLLAMMTTDVSPRLMHLHQRPPFLFYNGALHGPPLPPTDDPIAATTVSPPTPPVSWRFMTKEVVLSSVQLRLVSNLNEALVCGFSKESTDSNAVKNGAFMGSEVGRLHFTQTVQLRHLQDNPAERREQGVVVELAQRAVVNSMNVSRISTDESTELLMLPTFSVLLAKPLLQTVSFFFAGMQWETSCFVSLQPSASCPTFHGSDAEAARLSDLVYANFMKSDHATPGSNNSSDSASPLSTLHHPAVSAQKWSLQVEGPLHLEAWRDDDDVLGSITLEHANMTLHRCTSEKMTCSGSISAAYVGCQRPWKETPQTSPLLSSMRAGRQSQCTTTQCCALLHLGTTAPQLPVNPCSMKWSYNRQPMTISDERVDGYIEWSCECFAPLTIVPCGKKWKDIFDIFWSLALRNAVARVCGWSPYLLDTDQDCIECNASEAATSSLHVTQHLYLQDLCLTVPSFPASQARSSTTLLLELSDITFNSSPHAAHELTKRSVRVGKLRRCGLECSCSAIPGDGTNFYPYLIVPPMESQHDQPTTVAHTALQGLSASGDEILAALFSDAPQPAAKWKSGQQVHSAENLTAAPLILLEWLTQTSPAPASSQERSCILRIAPLWAIAPEKDHVNRILISILPNLGLSSFSALIRLKEEQHRPRYSAGPSLVSLDRSIDFLMESCAFLIPDSTSQRADRGDKAKRKEWGSLPCCSGLLLTVKMARLSWPGLSGGEAVFHSHGEGDISEKGQLVLFLEDVVVKTLSRDNADIPIVRPFSITLHRLLPERRRLSVSEAPVVQTETEEVWRCHVDPFGFTLSIEDYKVLLHTAAQQAALCSSIIAATKSSSPENRTSSAALQAHKGTPKRLEVILESMGLRVCDGRGKSVYLNLQKLTATCCLGPLVNVGCDGAGDRADVCIGWLCAGTDGSTPSLRIDPLPSCTGDVTNLSGVERRSRESFLQVKENATTGAYVGEWYAGRLSVTLETVAMLAWVELLYLPYAEVVMPECRTSAEHVIESDWTLTEDLTISRNKRLRVIATSRNSSLIYLDGGDHIIRFDANEGGDHLISLDAGITLMVVNAILYMGATSIDYYVDAGNGSYVAIDRETCTVLQAETPVSETKTMEEVLGSPTTYVAATRWQRFVAMLELHVSIPPPPSQWETLEPTSAARRSLCISTQVHLCAMQTAPQGSSMTDITAAFDLADLRVQHESRSADGKVWNATDLITEWGLKVLLSQENSGASEGASMATSSSNAHPSNPSQSPPVMALAQRVLHISASRGMEILMRYSDLLFLYQAIQHARDAVFQLLGNVEWAALRSRPWARLQTREIRASVSSGAITTPPSSPRHAKKVNTTSIDLQIPLLSICAVDDSHTVQIPLFRLSLGQIVTSHCIVESPLLHCKLSLLLQLEHYSLAKSQWSPVTDPVPFEIIVHHKRSRSTRDVYRRLGNLHLALQLGNVKSYISPELLGSAFKLFSWYHAFISRREVVSTLAQSKDPLETSEKSSAPSSHFNTHVIRQSLGVDIEVEFAGNLSQGFPGSRCLRSGESFSFSFPRSNGKELTQSQQCVVVRQCLSSSENKEGKPNTDCHAIIPLTSTGLRCVAIGLSEQQRRHTLAELRVEDGQKVLHLRTNISIKNDLSADLKLLELRENGGYHVRERVAAGQVYNLPLSLLRLRILLATESAVSSLPMDDCAAVDYRSVVSLGMSYDGLPCVSGAIFLCASNDAAAKPVSKVSGVARGKNFRILRAPSASVYFFLHVEKSKAQALEVQKSAELASLRSIVLTARAGVTVRNEVGLPITIQLFTRRHIAGSRIGFLDTAPDTTDFTEVAAASLDVGSSFPVTAGDLLEDLCLSVTLRQPSGAKMGQWTDGPSATAFYKPVCIYAPQDSGQRGKQLVVADLLTGATLTLQLQYSGTKVVVYCPYWIINETDFNIQVADATTATHSPIAGLGGRTVSTATIQPIPRKAGSAPAQPFLYYCRAVDAGSLSDEEGRASVNKAHPLQIRFWHTDNDSRLPPHSGSEGWSQWSTEALTPHDLTEEGQLVQCCSKTQATTFSFCCSIEMGRRSSVPAYSDTRVIFIRPRWVLLNRTPYSIAVEQTHSRRATYTPSPATALWQLPPFSHRALSFTKAARNGESVAFDATSEVCLRVRLVDSASDNVRECAWTPTFSVDTEHSFSLNLVYLSFIPIGDYWPQSGASSPSSSTTTRRVTDVLPPLRPEDIREARGEHYVACSDAKVLSITVYRHASSVTCVSIEEATNPPFVVENRTNLTIQLRQRGVQRITTIYPRARKAWTWETPPSRRQPPIMDLWVVNTSSTVDSPPTAPCSINFDPSQFCRYQGTQKQDFQQELEVSGVGGSTSRMLYIRVRGIHGLSYAISITNEGNIDGYRSRPYPQLSLSLEMKSLYLLFKDTDNSDVLLCGVMPIFFSLQQGGQQALGGHAYGGDVQRLEFSLRSFQIDDERSSSRERVVLQFVDHGESGFKVERLLLRTTPMICCPTVEVKLVPVELHLEDSFIAAMLAYVETITAALHHNGRLQNPRNGSQPWTSLSDAAAHAPSHFALWESQLEREMDLRKQNHRCGVVAGPRLSWWHRTVVIGHLLISPLLTSVSLYRSPGSADDPLWKLYGAISILIGSASDTHFDCARTDERDLCDVASRLFHRRLTSYKQQLQKQYHKLVSVIGLSAMRSAVMDLFQLSGDTSRDGIQTGQRQKRRRSCRAAAQFQLDHHVSSTLPIENVSRISDADERGGMLLNRASPSVHQDSRGSMSALEAARILPWTDFLSRVGLRDLRRYGAVALATIIHQMAGAPRYSLRGNCSERQQERHSTAELLQMGARTGSTSQLPSSYVSSCTRCSEIVALREQRLRDGFPTPLPHPISEGFITWEELTHHVDWFEFCAMCSDAEIQAYASLVFMAAVEQPKNVVVVTF